MFEKLSNLFRRPATAGGKDPMAGETTATPGIDTKALGEAIAASLTASLGPALATAIGEANKPLVEQLGKLQPPAAAAGNAAANTAGGNTAGGNTAGAGATGGKPAPVTAEDVAKIVAEQLKGFQQTSQQTAQREAYLGSKLKDLPAAYRNQLGPDPAKWAAEEQAIRDQFKADLAAAGVKPADVGGDQPGGQKPGQAVDLSKLSPVQKVMAGLAASTPQGARGNATPATAVATGATATAGGTNGGEVAAAS